MSVETAGLREGKTKISKLVGVHNELLLQFN